MNLGLNLFFFFSFNPQLRSMFQRSYGEVVTLSAPGEEDRKSFFSDLLLVQAARAPPRLRSTGTSGVHVLGGGLGGLKIAHQCLSCMSHIFTLQLKVLPVQICLISLLISCVKPLFILNIIRCLEWSPRLTLRFNTTQRSTRAFKWKLWPGIH